MKTYILKELNDAKAARIDDLLHMLNPEMPALEPGRLEALMGDEGFSLFVAEDETGGIAGMLTLTRCQTLSRGKYWIEDVIVDAEYRGMGVGRALVRSAVEHVKAQEKAPVIYLTSNPSRVSARALYLSEGFEEYETGVFRLPRP